jgi:hypothetical protein
MCLIWGGEALQTTILYEPEIIDMFEQGLQI